jgi:hypothetical protein
LRNSLLDEAKRAWDSANCALEYGDRDNAMIYKGRANAFEEAEALVKYHSEPDSEARNERSGRRNAKTLP